MAHQFHLAIPAVGTTLIDVSDYPRHISGDGHGGLCGVFLLYRRITIIGKLASFLWVGVIGSALWIIVSGLLHFNARQAFTFSTGCLNAVARFLPGARGGAADCRVENYWGYYNVCYLGAEVRDPARTIPRAILLSIG